MPGPDTLVEEAPVLVYLLIGLGFLLTWAAMRSLRYVWLHTIGWVIGKIADVGIPTGFFGSVHPLRWLKDVNTTVMNYLAAQALEAEQAMGHAFHQAAYVQEWIVKELWGGLRDLYQWADGLQNTYLGKLFKALFTALFPWVVIGRLIRSIVHAAAAAVRSEVHSLERSIPRRFHKLIRAAVIAAFPLVVTLPWLHREVRTFNRRWETVKRRLLRLEALLTTVGFAAAMAASLGLKDWRCVTRGGVGRAARFLCGLDNWLLDLLLLGAVEAFVAGDLCEFTDLLMTQAEALKPELMALVDVEDALIGCHGTVKPIDFALPKLSLPPMPAPSVLAA